MEQSLYELLRRCTAKVSILGKAGHGTGFFVAPGLLLTCAHVVKSAQSPSNEVQVFWNQHSYAVLNAKIVLDADLALLHVDLTGHPCVWFTKEALPFDSLYSYGYPDTNPAGDPATFLLEGKAGDQGERLKFKAGQVRPGQSGAPLLNINSGYVCGIVQLTRGRANDLGGRAIPTNRVFQVFPELEALQRQYHRIDQHWMNCLWAYPTRTPQGKDRQWMLKRVRAFWITGVLEQSLYNASLIALGLQEKPGVVGNPWRSAVQESERPERLLPPDTSITEIYDSDSSKGGLLILGESGSGKTTLLLELARELLERARLDNKLPIPVYFNLSSWAMRRQPLTEWLASELHIRYQVPLPLATSWIETNQVLPLLDGLDEVATPYRAACVEAINIYRQAHGLLPTVVCSRQTDYLVLSTRLLLRTAVVVQPLTPEQIKFYLASGGERLEALRRTLREDADLQALAATPLMLNVLTVAYQGTPHKEVTITGSLETKQEQIFATYVQRMLIRRSAVTRYTPEQTTHWLSSLADQMKRQGQTIFYLEQMQPIWLSGDRRLRVYDWLAVRLPDVLMGVLVILTTIVFIRIPGIDLPFLIPYILLGSLLGGVLSEGNIPQRPIESDRKAGSALGLRPLQWLLIGVLIGLGSGLGFGLKGGLIYGLLFGLTTGLCSILLQFLLGKNNTTEARSQTPPLAGGTIWQRLIRRREIHNGLLVGLPVGLSFGLFYGLGVGLRGGLGAGLFYGLGAGLGAGLSAGFLSVLLIRRSTGIQPTDLLVWSWKSLGRSLFSKSHASATVQFTALIGLLFGLAAGLDSGLFFVLGSFYGLVHGPHNGPVIVLFVGLIFGLGGGLIFGLIAGLLIGLIYGLIFGLGYWLLLGLFQGVQGATIEDQRRVVPNQGIRHSALNGLALGLISTVIVGLLGWLSYGLYSGLDAGLRAGVLVGLSAGLLVGLLKGGLASFRHYVLRFLLWRTGAVPWHYVQFLDYAAERILLRRVGGGYIFLHRLLLDYFAAGETMPALDEPTERRQAGIPAPVSSSNVLSEPMVPTVLPDLSASTISLVSPAALSEAPHLLPCGHEQRTPHARFCSVCGASVTMPNTPI